MIGFRINWHRPQPALPELPQPEWINVGDTVRIIDDCEGTPGRIGREGRVQMIALSPYYREEVAGVLRAYVVPADGFGWADWCLAEELTVIQKQAVQRERATA